MCPHVGTAFTNSTSGPSEQEVGASAPAGVPIRLVRGFPREHHEVSLPPLRPKAVFGQGPAGQLRGLGEGQRHCLQATLPFTLQEGKAGSGPGEWRGHPGSWVAVCAPHPGLPIQELGSCLPPSSFQLERSLKPSRDLGWGLMALLTTDASSLRNRIPLCF